MKIPFPILARLGALAAALALTSGPVRADDDEESTTTRIKFSDPAKPGTLKASLPWGELHVTGTTGNEIVVTSTLQEKGHKQERPDGLRRLDDEVSFELTEKDNVASLQVVGDNPWAAQGAEFKIQVPHNTALVLRTEVGGEMLVENIDGDIEINSMNGEVTLRDIGSGAVVNTMNGEINAVFKNAPTKAVSFSSMNGEITLKLPVTAKANLRMRSHNGAILTDFPDSALKAHTESRGRGEPGETPEAANPAVPDEAALASADKVRDEARQAKHEAEQAMREADQAKHEAEREVERVMRESQQTVKEVQDAIAANPGRVPHPPHIPRPPMVPAFGGKSVIGTLNGGGVDIQLATMNGSITLRELK